MTYQNAQLCWLNHTTQHSDAEVSTVVDAVRAQVHEDFGPIWHTGVRQVFGGPALPTDWVVELIDWADIPGALGYHELETGRPWMKVFVETARQYSVPWSSVASHEVLEALADPFIDRTVQTASTTFTALEVCDPCEVKGYIKLGVAVSDFVTPRWFDDQAVAGPFNWLNTITRSGQLLPGGYIGFWTPATGWTTRNADGAVVREHRRRREVFEE